jgi:hypothetical protein
VTAGSDPLKRDVNTRKRRRFDQNRRLFVFPPEQFAQWKRAIKSSETDKVQNCDDDDDCADQPYDAIHGNLSF